MSREHDQYVVMCNNLEKKIEEIIKERKLLKDSELRRIGNKPACEVTFAEKEWYRTMERDGGMSTRMY